MNKKRKLEAVSFWPGYVDALVNVVLNTLFLVGLLAVGLMSLNLESLDKNNELKLALTLEKTRNDTLLLAALGTVTTTVDALGPEVRQREEEQLRKKAREQAPPAEPEPQAERPRVIQVGRMPSAETRQAETDHLQASGAMPGRFWTTHQGKRFLTAQELDDLKAQLAAGPGTVVLHASFPEQLPQYKEPIFMGLQRLQLRLGREGVATSRIRLLMKPSDAHLGIPGDVIHLWIDRASGDKGP